MLFRRTLPYLLISFFAPLWVLAQTEGVTILPPITIQAEGPKAVAIDVQSGNSNVRNLAAMAFQAHGAYEITRTGTFTFSFEPVANNAVRLRIASGKPRQVQLEETVQGSDWREATLRACDLAVRKTSGKPGFFAGKLAFVSDKTGKDEIYVGDVFFQRVRQITNDGSTAMTPRWSPDGNRLLYTTYFKTGFPDIYQLTFTGSGIRRVPFATFRGTNQGGTFSPDGGRVAMVLSSSGNPEVYVSDATGRNPRRLTNNRSVEASPSWSPDGRRLVVSSDLSGGPQLFEIGANGGELRRIPTNISGYCTEPAWNPRNADQIAFTAAVAGSFQIALYDRAEGKSQWVTKHAGEASQPRWANDGRHLFYTLRYRNGREELRIVDTLTKKSQSLSGSFGNAAQAGFIYP